MKHVQSFAVAFTALVIVGCGGSGTNHNTTVVPTGDLSTPRVEAIVRVERTNIKHPNNWTDDQLLDPTNLALQADLIDPTVFGYQDPTNFQTGERFIFQLAAYHADGTRVILPATFSTLDLSGTYGNLGTNSGAFDASLKATSSDQTMLAVYNGNTYQAIYDVKERQARVIGKVQLQTTNAPVAGVVVDFYDQNNFLSSKVTTAPDGTFRASAPIASVKFSVDPHSLSTSIYNVFVFGGPTYAAGNPDCEAPLPALVVGTNPALGTIDLVPAVAGQPQPTTDGCVGP